MNDSSKFVILILPSYYPSKEKPYYGIFIKDFAKAISLRNKVLILSHETWKNPDKSSYFRVTHCAEDKIDTYRIYQKKSSLKFVNYCLYLISHLIAFRQMKRDGYRPNIIHAHVYYAGVIGYLLAKFHGIPMIITEHSSKIPIAKKPFFNFWLAKMAYSSAYMILPVSFDMQQNIKKLVKKKTFCVIPNAIDTNKFQYDPKKTNKNDINILAVSNLVNVKGIHVLIDAMYIVSKTRNDFMLRIAGDGPDRNLLERKVDRFQISDHVAFLGGKPREELCELYSNCDFFVCSSTQETFGVAVLEALSCGKPVIASRLPVLEEKIDKSRGILTEPGDPNSLAQGILTMMAQYRAYPSEALREYVEKQYSYEAVSVMMQRIYKNVIEEYSK